MKVFILIPTIISASAVTSDISLSRMRNPSNVNELNRNVSLRRLGKRHKGPKSTSAKIAAEETGKDQSKPAPIKEDAKPAPTKKNPKTERDHKKKREDVESTQATDTRSGCPPTYDITKTDYVGGDFVTVAESIFECNPTLVKYCNIGEWDESLESQDANAEDLWSGAWVYFGPCSISEVVLESTSSPTSSPTSASSIKVASVQDADAIPACPPAYDITKTDYVGGDTVTITDNIFECNTILAKYCNIGEWDDALLDEDPNAEYFWSDAWVHVGPCSILAIVSEPKSMQESDNGVSIIKEIRGKTTAKKDHEKKEEKLKNETAKTESIRNEPVAGAATADGLASTPSLPKLPLTVSPTSAPFGAVESTQVADVIPACPPAYDSTKADYLGGDTVTITGNMFECHSLYVMYCNIGEWDDALLAQDANAEELWSGAATRSFASEYPIGSRFGDTTLHVLQRFSQHARRRVVLAIFE
ncbi:hypothetical protein ACHAXA_007697 [Cyclostephanos tholiformis]|uniref:Uncharacterized protein n=1 Tax=Cyclostephanos tholiformis TaxID=382380 RepID=A0ABD3R410_9STRA